MDRRHFLLAAGAAGAAAASGAGFWRWQQLAAEVRAPGREFGHLLRDRKAVPPPRANYDTDVVILGSGAAGLIAAWKLAKHGLRKFALVTGPEPDGNLAAGNAGEARFPTGAHYLPLPSRESIHVREMLADLGIILRGEQTQYPYFDERYVVHAPESRALIDGTWHEGLLPMSAFGAEDGAQQQRFSAHMEHFADSRGSDGLRAFAMPIALSSEDPQWRELDKMTFKDWLARESYTSAPLISYLDYACRDDYGRGCAEVSAYAGVHYFASRAGEAENAERGAVLTWPEGLAALAVRLARAAGLAQAHADARTPIRIDGAAVSLRETRTGVEALCVREAKGGIESYTVSARRAICAMPLFVAARVIEGLNGYGFEARTHLPEYSPWLVSNFVLTRFPAERPGAALAWDNIVHGSGSLGYVVSTHQDVRIGPPPRTVYTAYHALAAQSPQQAREWMQHASPDELLALASTDLRAAYGWKLAACCERAEITLRAHAMAVPRPSYLSNRGVQALRRADGRILFAHADLSGYSVFEEAAWWGWRAATLALR